MLLRKAKHFPSALLEGRAIGCSDEDQTEGGAHGEWLADGAAVKAELHLSDVTASAVGVRVLE